MDGRGERAGETEFTLERITLTDSSGRAVPAGSSRPEMIQIVGITIDDALDRFVRAEGAVLVGPVLRLPGPQTVATARVGLAAWTLQILPRSLTEP